MNKEQQRQLEKMIKENNVQDNTQNIRNEKKSGKIRECVDRILEIKKDFSFSDNDNPSFKQLDEKCMCECSYLFINFPNIYNKLLKDEIDVNILYRFLHELSLVENGVKNQHEASFTIGELLKKMYIDKRLGDAETTKQTQRKEKLNKKTANLSWSDYKRMNK